MNGRKFGNRKFFTLGSGVGSAEDYILAFDRALREAGFADYNLLKVSSILPAHSSLAKEITLPKGSLLPIAYAEIHSNEEGKIIGSAVAVAIPEDEESIGVIMEVKGFERKEVLIRKAEELCLKAMEDRGIKVKEVISTGADAEVKGGFVCVFSGVAIWESQE
jgi:arginine decarboxylase